MSVRNGFIAHRGDNEFEEGIIFIQINRQDPDDITFAMESLRVATSSYPDLLGFCEVIEHL